MNDYYKEDWDDWTTDRLGLAVRTLQDELYILNQDVAAKTHRLRRMFRSLERQLYKPLAPERGNQVK